MNTQRRAKYKRRKFFNKTYFLYCQSRGADNQPPFWHSRRLPNVTVEILPRISRKRHRFDLSRFYN